MAHVLSFSQTVNISLPETLAKALPRSQNLISIVRCNKSNGDDDRKGLKINGHRNEEASSFGRFTQRSENTTLGLVKTLKENGNEYSWGKVTVRIINAYSFYWSDERPVQIAYQARKRFPNDKIWIINDIKDNPTVNKRLRKMDINDIPFGGLRRKLDVISKGDIVILPAANMSVKELYYLTEVRYAQVLDTTCPLSEVQEAVKNHQKRNYTSIIHGDVSHSETIAIASIAGKYIIVNNIAEARNVCDYILGGQPYGYTSTKEEFFKNFRAQVSEGLDPDIDLVKVGIAGQPAMYRGETKAIGNLFMKTMMHSYGVENIDKHFYDATQHLQVALHGLVEKNLDFILVIGEMDSSNITHVQEIAELKGIPCYWIDNEQRIGPLNRIYHKNGGKLFVKEKWIMAGPITVGVIMGATKAKTVENALLKVFEINLKETMWFE